MNIVLATEDELSEAIGMRVLKDFCVSSMHDIQRLRKDGNGYLYSKMKNWREIATNQESIILILTDLDRLECPVTLLKEWGACKNPLPANLLLRIAVREVESWVLADHEGVRKLIGPKGALPPKPDNLPEPRQHFLDLVRKFAPRPIKQGLLPAKGVIASKGLEYNHILKEWIGSDWNPQRGAMRSSSLRRALAALKKSPLCSQDKP